MPGYGFSGKPTGTGWGPEHIARAWAELMKRLGYDRYVAQGGDWGAFIVDLMGVQAPPGLLGIHTNMPARCRPTSTRPPWPATRRRPVSPPRSTHLREADKDFFATDVAYALSWGPTRRRCTESRIHPSAWPPGCSTTTYDNS